MQLTNVPRDGMLHALEKAWPTADPAGWKAYLETHPVGAYGENLWLNEQVKGLVGAGNRAEAGKAILSQLPPDADRQAAVLAIVRPWSEDDPQAAVTWAAGKVDAAGREKLLAADRRHAEDGSGRSGGSVAATAGIAPSGRPRGRHLRSLARKGPGRGRSLSCEGRLVGGNHPCDSRAPAHPQAGRGSSALDD